MTIIAMLAARALRLWRWRPLCVRSSSAFALYSSLVRVITAAGYIGAGSPQNAIAFPSIIISQKSHFLENNLSVLVPIVLYLYRVHIIQIPSKSFVLQYIASAWEPYIVSD